MNKIKASTPVRQDEGRIPLSILQGATKPAAAPRGKGFGTNPAQSEEARRAGRDAVQTNANKVNTRDALEGPKTRASKGKQGDKLTPEELHKKRIENEELRRTTRTISGIPRVQKCCHTVMREAGVGVVIDYDAKEKISGYRGLYSCSSVWACDRCAGLIQRARFLEVWEAMEVWTTKGAKIATQYRDYGPEGENGRGLLWSSEPGNEEIQGPAGYIDAKNGGIVWPGVNDVVSISEETGEIVERALRRFRLVDVEVEHEPGGIVFMTLTMQHERARKAGTKYSAAPLWKAEGAAFKRLTNDRFFKGEIHAYNRTVEVQYSHRAGWHIHMHVGLYVSKDFREKAARGKLFKAWQSAVAKEGYVATKQGFDLRKVTDLEKAARDIAGYITKGASRSLAAELTQNGDKKSRFSISPAQMRALMHAERMRLQTDKSVPLDDDALELLRIAVGPSAKPFAALGMIYAEYERASFGKRWLTWSRGAKKAFGILDVPDEAFSEPSEAELNGDALPLDPGTGEIAGFTSKEWRVFAAKAENKVDLRQLVEAQQHKPAALEALEAWSEESGFSIILGDDWDKRLEKKAGEADAKRAAEVKIPTWASRVHTLDEVEASTVYEKGTWSLSDPAAVPAGQEGWVHPASMFYRRAA